MAQCQAVEKGQRPSEVQGLLPPLELPSRETSSEAWPVPVLGPRRRQAHESYLPILVLGHRLGVPGSEIRPVPGQGPHRRPADDVEERSTETQAWTYFGGPDTP